MSLLYYLPAISSSYRLILGVDANGFWGDISAANVLMSEFFVLVVASCFEELLTLQASEDFVRKWLLINSCDSLTDFALVQVLVSEQLLIMLGGMHFMVLVWLLFWPWGSALRIWLYCPIYSVDKIIILLIKKNKKKPITKN